jgi:hypothetical protein
VPGEAIEYTDEATKFIIIFLKMLDLDVNERVSAEQLKIDIEEFWK